MEEEQKEFIAKLKVGDMTLYGAVPYVVEKIVNGVVTLTKTNGKGAKTSLPNEIPYPKDGVFIQPPLKSKASISGVINISSMLKQHTELQISRPLVAFVKEHIESILVSIMSEAERLALQQGKKRIEPAHWYWLDVPVDFRTVYEAEHNDYTKNVLMKGDD